MYIKVDLCFGVFHYNIKQYDEKQLYVKLFTF